MKKMILILSIAALLGGCGGGGSKETSNDTIVSPKMQELHKSSQDTKAKSEELNKKADSLLKNI